PERFERAFPDSTSGPVDDPSERGIVARIGDDAKDAEGVLHFLSLKKGHSAHDLVRNALAPERLLENPALSVGAVKDREILPRPVLLLRAPEDLLSHPFRLFAVFIQDHFRDRLALPSFGPKFLGMSFGVLGDHA